MQQINGGTLAILMVMHLSCIFAFLHTEGTQIIDPDSGEKIRLKCVNWYGAHQETFTVGGLEKQTIANISRQIVLMGANCARIPYSIEMVRDNPFVPSQFISAMNSNECPHIGSITALELLDCVVRWLTADGLMIILNNHVSMAGWVGVNASARQGLWNLPGYPTSSWITSLRDLSRRYSDNRLVVGMDIRNEIHDMVAPVHLVSKLAWMLAEPFDASSAVHIRECHPNLISPFDIRPDSELAPQI